MSNRVSNNVIGSVEFHTNDCGFGFIESVVTDGGGFIVVDDGNNSSFRVLDDW